MVDSVTLFLSVLTLFVYMLPGFLMKKLNALPEGFSASFSKFVLYVGQVCMLIYGYIRPYDMAVSLGMLEMFLIAAAVHAGGFFAARAVFRRAPERTRDILVFGTMFSNAGYMGIPVITMVLGREYIIYASIYIGVFNIFTFTLGRLVYTHDRRFVSARGVVLNPGVIPVLVGMLIYFTGTGGWITARLGMTDLLSRVIGVFYQVFGTFSDLVGPLSMVVIGVGLSSLKLGDIVKDGYVYVSLAMRLLLIPATVWCVLRLLYGAGVMAYPVYAVAVILASTPTAAATSIFAELYVRDSVYGSKLVSVSTLLSALTMPVVAMLLYL